VLDLVKTSLVLLISIFVRGSVLFLYGAGNDPMVVVDGLVEGPSHEICFKSKNIHILFNI